MIYVTTAPCSTVAILKTVICGLCLFFANDYNKFILSAGKYITIHYCEQISISISIELNNECSIKVCIYYSVFCSVVSVLSPTQYVVFLPKGLPWQRQGVPCQSCIQWEELFHCSLFFPTSPSLTPQRHLHK